MPRWCVVGSLVTVLACAGCDRVFGVEGTASSVDARGSGQLDGPTNNDAPTNDALHFYSDAVLADNPVAYYRLDEVTGPMAKDAVGNVDGTYVGDILLGQDRGVLAEDGAAPQFGLNDMNNSGVVFGNDFAFDGAQAFALELWIFPTQDATATVRYILSKWRQSPVSTGYVLYTEGADKIAFVRDQSASSRGRVEAPINPSGWSHVVASYDNAVMTLFIDGVRIMDSVSQQTIPTSTTPFVIGSGDGNATTNPFRGQIDDVAIYAHPLSREQALAHYEAAGVAD